MKLEVNKEHKKIRYGKMNKPFQKFKAGVAGLMIAVSMFSGAAIDTYAKTADNNSIVWNIDGLELKFSQSISSALESRLNKKPGDVISREELSKVDSLVIFVDDDTKSLSELEAITNLKSLTLYLETDNYSILKTLSNVASIEDLTIFSNNYGVIDKDMVNAMNRFGHLKKLELNDHNILEPGCEEELNKLESLKIYNGSNCDIDFSKLTNLKELDLSEIKPYDIAIFLNSDEYNTLIDNGVNIKFKDSASKNDYLCASDKLNDIINKLDIDENSTDSEKLDAVMVFVLEYLCYDESVSKAIADSEEHEALTESFYEKGKLYGALEKDSAICGNYASLTEALMDRLSIPQTSYYAESENHAWNVVKIDGEPYYVDVTWLDGLLKETQHKTETEKDGHKVIEITFDSEKAEDIIKRGEGHSLNWYRENPDQRNIAKIDQNSSHEATYIPEYMLVDENEETASLREQEATENATEIGNDQVKVNIGGKEIAIGLGALLGVLGAGAGTVIAIKRKKDKERRRRMMSQYSDPFSYTDTDSYGSGRYR